MIPQLNPVFADRPVTIFAVMSALAQKYDAINLGQGFPDETGPRQILEDAARALIEGNNQYGPVRGASELCQAVARVNKRFYGLDVDAATEVQVTSGASEALAASFLGFLRPGDEAILFAPYYDSYAPMVEAAGAKPIIIQLDPPAWRITHEALEQVITAKTRVIAINTPHNPLGKVMDRQELEVIARAACSHDLLVICDEVYEHLIFDGQPHIPLMTLPGMRERCVRIGSAGKTFSLTGWRIGYVTGPSHLISTVMKTRQYLGYTTPIHLQLAIAKGLDLGDDYYINFTAGMQEKRDFLMAGLRQAGFDVLPCAGTYFITVDVRPVLHKSQEVDDMQFCKELTRTAKVTAVPLSAFYHHQYSDPPRHYIRFCFCKRQDVLAKAVDRLVGYFSKR